MKIIGITGSVASGKTTASKILSSRRGPLFIADKIVKEIYRKKSFKRALSEKFNIRNLINLKSIIRKKIIEDKSNILKLERLIHPLVRKEMKKFLKKNKNKKFVFLEIPLLVESNLTSNFDKIIFIKAKRKIRLHRFLANGGNKHLFKILDGKQYNDSEKIKHCDAVVVNEKNIKILKKKLSNIIKNYG